MKQGFRQAMTWLHNWTGLVVGWLLLAIAAAGTLCVFRQELDAWMHPELARIAVDQVRAGASAIHWLGQHATASESWFLDLADARSPGTLAYWFDGKDYTQRMLSPITGTPDAIRDSLGGEFFYRFHFELQLPYPWGRLLAVVAAEIMLMILITGIVAHRRIFKDFFTFRTGKGQRSWLDGHMVLGVLALPFHLMITLTGVITLVNLFLPWGGVAAYHGDAAALMRDFYPGIERPKSNHPAPLAPIEPMLRTALQRFDGTGISMISVYNPGDKAAVITVSAGEGPGVAVQQHNISFDGVTGRILDEHVETRPAMKLHQFLYGMHMGRFAGLASRWLYFLSGMMLTAAIATGLIHWSVKRRGRNGFGHHLVERLNVGFIAGMPAGFAAFLVANRLLPVDMAARPAAETRWLFLVWGVAILFAMIRAPERSWRELLWFAAAMCGAVVLADLTTTRLPGGLEALDGVAVGVDGCALLFACLFAFAAGKVARKAAAA